MVSRSNINLIEIFKNKLKGKYEKLSKVYKIYKKITKTVRKPKKGNFNFHQKYFIK